MNKREKPTIIFVNKDQNAVKPIQVPSRLITDWKKYFFGIAGIFLILISIIFYLTYNQIKLKKSEADLVKQLQIAKATQPIDTPTLDTVGIREKFASLDEKLIKINKSLKARGLKTAFPSKQNHFIEFSNASLDKLNRFYNKYLNSIIYNLGNTPLGFPYHGNITSTFGQRENPFTNANVERHKGLDIKGPKGSLVKATANGKVEFTGRKGGFGNCIVIKHGNGFETLYGHLSKILVSEGQSIEIGENIGKIGSTGRSTGPHLHYEVHKNGKPINPRGFLNLE